MPQNMKQHLRPKKLHSTDWYFVVRLWRRSMSYGKSFSPHFVSNYRNSFPFLLPLLISAFENNLHNGVDAAFIVSWKLTFFLFVLIQYSWIGTNWDLVSWNTHFILLQHLSWNYDAHISFQLCIFIYLVFIMVDNHNGIYLVIKPTLTHIQIHMWRLLFSTD